MVFCVGFVCVCVSLKFLFMFLNAHKHAQTSFTIDFDFSFFFHMMKKIYFWLYLKKGSFIAGPTHFPYKDFFIMGTRLPIFLWENLSPIHTITFTTTLLTCFGFLQKRFSSFYNTSICWYSKLNQCKKFFLPLFLSSKKIFLNIQLSLTLILSIWVGYF